MSGALEAIALLSRHFTPVVVVTNQAGIGKGLMTEADLMAIHGMLIRAADAAGGQIDAVYYCPHRSDAGCSCRKPSTGMGELVRLNYPDFDWENAWMVGDSYSDILFGKSLALKTALISGKAEDAPLLKDLTVDWQGPSLLDFARFVVMQ